MKKKLTVFERALLNAAIVGGITFFSTLNVSYPPTMANVYAATIGMVLAILTQLKSITTIEVNQDGKPKTTPLLMLV